MLCEKRSSDPSTCSNKEINLAAHSTQQLLLYPAKGSTLIGKYIGNVTIGASEKQEGETAAGVYGSTPPLKFAGVATIFIGVVLAWILTVYLQNRLNRNQMLLPVTMLRERFQALQAILTNRPPRAQPFACTATTAELARSLSALSEATLDADGLLPPGIPNPFKPVTPNAEAFMQRISEQKARFELLQLIIRNGLQEIWKQIPAAPSANQRNAITTAVGAVDSISSQTPPPAVSDVVTRLQAILQTLNTELAGGGAANVAAMSTKPPTSGQISTEIRTLSGIAWLVFAVLTTALGTYVLVLSNFSGFGTYMPDFLVFACSGDLDCRSAAPSWRNPPRPPLRPRSASRCRGLDPAARQEGAGSYQGTAGSGPIWRLAAAAAETRSWRKSGCTFTTAPG